MGYISELVSALQILQEGEEHLQSLLTFVRETKVTGTLWIAGNGGSAANAMHWACDLAKAAEMRAQALGCNPSLSSALSNDISYEGTLAHEFKRLAGPDDRLICLSCSGTSPNIVTLLRQAWIMKIPRAILTGDRWMNPTPVSVVVQVASRDYATIEDVHAAIGHWLTKELIRGYTDGGDLQQSQP